VDRLAHCRGSPFLGNFSGPPGRDSRKQADHSATSLAADDIKISIHLPSARPARLGVRLSNESTSPRQKHARKRNHLGDCSVTHPANQYLEPLLAREEFLEQWFITKCSPREGGLLLVNLCLSRCRHEREREGGRPHPTLKRRGTESRDWTWSTVLFRILHHTSSIP
jgi:hypothetical protein